MLPSSVDLERLGLVLLAWLWCQKGTPASEAKIVKGVEPVLPAGSKAVAAEVLARLVTAGDIERIAKQTPKGKPAKPDYRIASPGVKRLRDTLKRQDPPKSSPFPSLLRGPFAALAIGFAVPANTVEEKAFKNVPPIAVCVRSMALAVPLEKGSDVAICAMLGKSLGRLYDPPTTLTVTKVPAGELPAMIIAPLLGLPASKAAFANVDALFQAVAQRVLDVRTPAQVSQHIVRQWITGDATAPSVTSRAGAPAGGNGAVDLKAFAGDVLAAARDVVRTGGPGVSNLRDQVLVASVWERYETLFGFIPLDAFKRRLHDANGDHLILVCEDRIPAEREREFSDSEVRTGTTSYHYVRV